MKMNDAEPPNPPMQTSENNVPTLNETPKTIPKRRTKIFWLCLCIVSVLIIAAAAGGYLILKKANDPDVIFKKSIETSLSTSLVEQQQSVYSGPSTAKLDVQYDLSDISKPRVISTESFTEKPGNGTVSLKAFTTGDNTYSGLFNAPEPQNSKLPGATNKWVVLRQNGKSDQFYINDLAAKGITGTPLGTGLTDPRSALLGHIIFGNFSPSDRTDLTNFIVNNHIYRYQKSQVKSDKIDNRNVFVYDVTLDGELLKVLNHKVAPKFNINTTETDMTSSFNHLGNLARVKMYVAKDTKQLIRVDAYEKNDGPIITNIYTYPTSPVSLPLVTADSQTSYTKFAAVANPTCFDSSVIDANPITPDGLSCSILILQSL